jgi:hypothetical protein
VIVSLAAAAALLAAFGFIEVRSNSALMLIRVLHSRDRTGAYLISLCIGTALFGMAFFPTLGLAVLGTVAWSAVANSLRSQAAAAAAAAKTAAVHLSAAQAAALQKAAANHALATRFSQGYIVSAGIMLLALIITLVAIRVRRPRVPFTRRGGGADRGRAVLASRRQDLPTRRDRRSAPPQRARPRARQASASGRLMPVTP